MILVLACLMSLALLGCNIIGLISVSVLVILMPVMVVAAFLLIVFLIGLLIALRFAKIADAHVTRWNRGAR